MKFLEFLGRTKLYKKVSDEDARKSQALLEINSFIQEQKYIILFLDIDVEHTYLYNTEEWKYFNALSTDDIINDPRKYEKILNELKLKVLDRNYPILAKAVEIQDQIKSVFFNSRNRTIKDDRNFLGTIGDHAKNNDTKFFGLIERDKINKLDEILEKRNEIVGINTIEAAKEYIKDVRQMQLTPEYKNAINQIGNLQNKANTMQNNKLLFSKRCENQLKQILNGDKNIKSCDELKLSIYMTIFSQYFDSKNSLEVTDEDLNRIMSKVWVKIEKESEIGKIYMPKDKYDEYNNIYKSADSQEEGIYLYRKEETGWILDQIRNGIMHGTFEVLESNGEKLINVFGDRFKSQFHFDCIIDICEKLFETSKNKILNDNFEELLDKLKKFDIEAANRILTTNKLDLFDLYVNSTIVYNEDLFHKKKDTIFNGLPEITEEMKTDRYIGWIRNATVHRYRELNDSNEIVIKDGKNGILEEKTRIDFNSFLAFLKGRNLIKNVEDNLERNFKRNLRGN